jgi:DnaK suppressor protein
MNQKKFQYFKNLLMNQLAELEDKSSKNRVTSLAESEQIFDFTDQATLESDIDMSMHIKERDSRLITKIKESLEKIEEGSYGICEECGEDISEKRLKVRPVATVCIDCKEKQENQKRLRGE